MNKDHLVTIVIAQQAAEWLERLPLASARENVAFMRWLRQSPMHAREFLLAVRTAQRLKHLDSKRLLDVSHFIALAKQYDAQPIAGIHSGVVPGPPSVQPHRISGPWAVAAAACFVVVLIVLAATLRAVSPTSIATAAGEFRTVHLADGSSLRAGPRTHATIAFTKHDRIVRLLAGELMIEVAKDRARPFYVETELATARAVGTAFAVRHFEEDTIVVTVQEGRVAVTRDSQFADGDRLRATELASVAAGEQVRVTTSAGPLQVRPVDLDKELAWITGKLQFTTETIGEAVREFNLRNEVQIKVLSPEIERRGVRGAFAVNKPRDFAVSVATSVGLTLVEDGTGTLLLAPARPPSTSASSVPTRL